MSTESMVTQADEQAAVDFLRDCLSVPWSLKDELAEAFARHRTAAQPEREAVTQTTESMVTQADRIEARRISPLPERHTTTCTCEDCMSDEAYIDGIAFGLAFARHRTAAQPERSK